MFSMVLVGSRSVSFDTDPDSGSSHFLIRIWIRIQGNHTDSTDPDLPHWFSMPDSALYSLSDTAQYSSVSDPDPHGAASAWIRIKLCLLDPDPHGRMWIRIQIQEVKKHRK